MQNNGYVESIVRNRARNSSPPSNSKQMVENSINFDDTSSTNSPVRQKYCPSDSSEDDGPLGNSDNQSESAKNLTKSSRGKSKTSQQNTHHDGKQKAQLNLTKSNSKTSNSGLNQQNESNNMKTTPAQQNSSGRSKRNRQHAEPEKPVINVYENVPPFRKEREPNENQNRPKRGSKNSNTTRARKSKNSSNPNDETCV